MAVVQGMWPGHGHCHSPLYLSSHPHGPGGIAVCLRPDIAPSQLCLSGPELATCRRYYSTMSFSGSQKSGVPTPTPATIQTSG